MQHSSDRPRESPSTCRTGPTHPRADAGRRRSVRTPHWYVRTSRTGAALRLHGEATVVALVGQLRLQVRRRGVGGVLRIGGGRGIGHQHSPTPCPGATDDRSSPPSPLCAPVDRFGTLRTPGFVTVPRIRVGRTDGATAVLGTRTYRGVRHGSENPDQPRRAGSRRFSARRTYRVVRHGSENPDATAPLSVVHTTFTDSCPGDVHLDATRRLPSISIDKRTFVLDTSVLLADPAALEKFEEHDVVIPLVVLTELEAKRLHPELGWSAREALRSLERLRVAHGSLTDPIPVNDRGGTVRVELNHIDASSLPEAFSSVGQRPPDPGRGPQPGRQGHRRGPGHEGPAAAPEGVGGRPRGRGVPQRTGRRRRLDRHRRARGRADPHRPSCTTTGRSTCRREPGRAPGATPGLVLQRARQFRARPASTPTAGPTWSTAIVSSSTSAAVRPSSAWPSTCWPTTRSGSCRLGGPAGTGKSRPRAGRRARVGARAAQPTAGRSCSVRCTRSAARTWATCRASESEKMNPWAAAVSDALEAMAGPRWSRRSSSGTCSRCCRSPTSGAGRLTDSFVIVDEAQNLERMVLLTALSRLGEGSRVVLTHDVAQRDNLRVGRHDGIASVVVAAARPSAVRPRDAVPLRTQPGGGAGQRPARRRLSTTGSVLQFGRPGDRLQDSPRFGVR